MVREMSGKSQGILLGLMAGHPECVNEVYLGLGHGLVVPSHNILQGSITDPCLSSTAVKLP